MKILILFFIAVAGMGINGCSTSVLEGEKIDYKSAGKLPSLEVPPDLIKPANDERYAIPDNKQNAPTLSAYNSQRLDPSHSQEKADVLPDVKQARIERAGSQRWLVVNRPPEQLWPLIREFWQKAGFLITIDTPETGIIETDWAENRAKIPQDIIRATIGKLFDSLYSTSERDKFRTRLERTDTGTEIYISHRGMQEVYSGQGQERTVWQPRPSDPELEAEFLRRLMLALGVEEKRAQAQLATVPTPDRADLVREKGQIVALRMHESFDRGWRRVGLALDRVGFTVEDRDRANGLYFVRYVDPGIDDVNSQKNQGFLTRLFGGGAKIEKQIQYRINLKAVTDINTTWVSVQNKEGQPEQSETAARILTLLHEQLK